jgi:hypothetical protein
MSSTTNPVIEDILDSFYSGFFPDPYTFTDSQIAAIAQVPGEDETGTFADAPMENALIHAYKLHPERNENTWPAFSFALKEEKWMFRSKFEGARKGELDHLAEAVATCVALGASREEVEKKVLENVGS